MSAIDIDGPSTGQSARCAPVLHALPSWFGLAHANDQYLRDIESLPTFVATRGDDAVGFLALRRHYADSAEILVMGVLPDMHRRGIGRALLRAAERWLEERGVEYLQVKTLAPSPVDAGYERTRRFYRAMEFVPLEELPLWDEHNPALLLVKRLGA